MSLETWLLFFAASIGLSLSPGPNGLLALTHGALYGRQRALFTILGGAVGFVIIIALSMFGIGALLKSSVVWLTVLKWLGGAYLIWLGIQVWRSPALDLSLQAPRESRSDSSLFRQGALSAVTNPKVLLFFSAFLPQFIDAQRSLMMQFLVMASTFVFTEIITEYVLASTAHHVRHWLGRVGRGFNRVCGGIFMTIGIALPLRG